MYVCESMPFDVLSICKCTVVNYEVSFCFGYICYSVSSIFIHSIFFSFNCVLLRCRSYFFDFIHRFSLSLILVLMIAHALIFNDIFIYSFRLIYYEQCFASIDIDSLTIYHLLVMRFWMKPSKCSVNEIYLFPLIRFHVSSKLAEDNNSNNNSGNSSQTV